MPPRRWIDKKSAQTFAVVHRAADDPKVHDPDAPQHVLVEVDRLNSKEKKQERRDKWRTRDPEEGARPLKTGPKARGNVGEALLYGIDFDDSHYDYMQHLRPVGENPDAVYIARRDQAKGSKVTGELALKADYAVANNVALLPQEVLPSQETAKRTYQDQQGLPDALAGLQPDMDANLREALEALEDEAYVEKVYGKEGEEEPEEQDDEDGDDLFNQLVKSGAADADEDEWDDYDGEYIDFSGDESQEKLPKKVEKKQDEQDWEYEFRKFKVSQTANDDGSDDEFEDERRDEVASLGKLTTHTRLTRASGLSRRQRRDRRTGGPGTEVSGLSMSSSALARNEGLTLLDERFDALDEKYNEVDSEDDEGEFDISAQRQDFEAALDDFLDNYYVEGKKLVKRRGE